MAWQNVFRKYNSLTQRFDVVPNNGPNYRAEEQSVGILYKGREIFLNATPNLSEPSEMYVYNSATNNFDYTPFPTLSYANELDAIEYNGKVIVFESSSVFAGSTVPKAFVISAPSTGQYQTTLQANPTWFLQWDNLFVNEELNGWNQINLK